MSLLNKASIITTPTAYAEDYLYSIKPAYALGSELVTNGDFSDGTNNWGGTATLSIDNGRLKLDGTAGQTADQTTTAIVGRKYQVTYELTLGTATSGALIITGGNYPTLDAAEGTNTFISTATSTSFRVRPRLGTNGTMFVDNISVKEITDADFDFTRNSTGTRLNEDYLIEDVPYNFVTYSEDFTQWTIQSGTTVTSNTTETLSPSGEYNASKIVGNGTSGIFNSGLSSIGGTNTKSIYIKGTEAGQVVYLKDPNQTVNNKVLTLTTEWQRYTLTESQTSDFGIWIDDIPTSGIYMWGAQVVKGDQPKDYLKTTDRLDIPRIDYTNGEPSILLEPSRTNNITQSTNFNGWNLSNVAISSNAIASPEGINNASKIYPTSTTTSAYAYLSVTGQTTSIYAKKGERNWIMIYGGFSDTNAYFDLDKGQFGTVKSQVQDYSFISYPNEWYRINITYTSNATQVRVYNVDGDNNLTSTPNGTDGIYIYGAQNEAGSYATSLIHTSGSTVTRSADVANNAGNSDLINSTEGVLYAEIKGLADDGTARTLSINNTVSNRVFMQLRSATGQVNTGVVVGGSLQGSSLSHNITQTDNIKMAFKYKASDYALYVNGSEVATQASGSTFSAGTLNDLSFDSGDGAEDFYGNVKMVAVFKEALSDTELACLTGYNSRELYLNYYNRLSFIGVTEEYNVESDINNYIL